MTIFISKTIKPEFYNFGNLPMIWEFDNCFLILNYLTYDQSDPEMQNIDFTPALDQVKNMFNNSIQKFVKSTNFFETINLNSENLNNGSVLKIWSDV